MKSWFAYISGFAMSSGITAAAEGDAMSCMGHMLAAMFFA